MADRLDRATTGGHMDDEIKSALEIAMEKVEKMGEATEEDRLKWKHTPQGEQLAARYLKEDTNLIVELNQYSEKSRKYVTEGASKVLIRNISLPKNDIVTKTNQKAIDGLKILKHDKVRAENIFSQLRRLFEHYATQGEQQRKEAFQKLKNELEVRLEQATQQQLGMPMDGIVDVEKQPLFQQEWRRVQTQLDSQYLTVLNGYTQELSSLP